MQSYNINNEGLQLIFHKELIGRELFVKTFWHKSQIMMHGHRYGFRSSLLMRRVDIFYQRSGGKLKKIADQIQRNVKVSKNYIPALQSWANTALTLKEHPKDYSVLPWLQITGSVSLADEKLKGCILWLWLHTLLFLVCSFFLQHDPYIEGRRCCRSTGCVGSTLSKNFFSLGIRVCPVSAVW